MVGNGLFAEALQVEIKNPAHNRCFRFIDLKLAVYEVVPIGGPAAVELAGFHSLLIAPPHVVGNGFRFLLRRHAGKGQEHFEVDGFSIDPLFLKVDADPDFPKRPYHGQQFGGVGQTVKRIL